MKNPSERGFTLIEMLVVLTLMVILMTMAVPVLTTTMRQAKIRGAAAEVGTLLRRARLEAIKSSCPAIVRTVDAVGKEPARFEAFADCSQPVDGQPDADRQIVGTVHLPTGVTLKAPPNVVGKDSITGFSDNPADPSGARVAIFSGDGSLVFLKSDGSLESKAGGGAFRLGDPIGNFLEVRVLYSATGRIELRKCLVCANEADSNDWKAEGEGGKAWAWK
jgi:prepilin-type N-terminal cleavage/methylation domain-containing protein